MSRLLIVCLVLAGLLAGAAAFSGGGDRTPADFTFINRGDHKTLDPGQMSWLQDIRIAYALWEGLYTLDPKTLLPVPGVSEKLDIDPTRKVYTFHLRHNGRWSNGDPVTSGDFVFAWRRMLEQPGDYTSLHFYVQGAQAYEEAYASWLQTPTGPPPDYATVGVKAPDDWTVIVTLRNPTPFFLSLCAFPAFFPEHEPSMRPYARMDDKTHRVIGYDEGFTRPPHLVGNGPYRLDEWIFKRSLRLVASDYYWNKGAVKCRVIDELVDAGALPNLRAFLSGRVDWLSWVEEDLIGQMRKAGGYPELHTFTGFGTEFYVLNCQATLPGNRPNPLHDARVRRALALAIDKRPIVENVVKAGEPAARDYIPPGVFADYPSPPGLPYDPVEARRLLAEAGYPGGRGFPLITLVYNQEMVQHADIALIVHSQWEENLGIHVDTQGLEVRIHGYRLQHQDFDIARASWIGDYPDPTTFTDKFKSDNENNDGRYSNKAYDALCDAAETETDPRERLKTLAKAENLMLEEAAIIPIYHFVDAYMFRPNVRGVQLDPRDMVMFQAIEKVGGRELFTNGHE